MRFGSDRCFAVGRWTEAGAGRRGGRSAGECGAARLDACGIVVAGRVGDEAVCVCWQILTVQPARRRVVWAERAVRAYEEMEADCRRRGEPGRRHGEGRDPRRWVLRCRCREVRASRGKWVRAEPVAALYAAAQGDAPRPGLSALEDRDVRLRHRAGFHRAASPDRLDALVWAVTDLMKRGTGPRITVL